MSQPSYQDDPTIYDEAVLWRRICPAWVVKDDNLGALRISSAAFDDSRDGTPLSMLLAEIVFATGRSEADVLVRHGGYSLATLKAGNARANSQSICRTPEVDEPAHISIAGPKTKSIRKQLAKTARWVIEPQR